MTANSPAGGFLMKRIFTVIHGWWTLMRAGQERGGWKCLAAGLPAVAMAAASLSALRGHEWSFLNRTVLTRTMMAEFLVVHSIAFLGLLVFWKTRTRKQVAVKWTCFAMLIAVYSLMALASGLDMFLMFFLGAGVSYFGVILNLTPQEQKKQLVARWIFCMCAYLLSIGCTETPEAVETWTDNRSVVASSLMYCVLLALAEFSGMYYLKVADFSPKFVAAIRNGMTRE